MREDAWSARFPTPAQRWGDAAAGVVGGAARLVPLLTPRREGPKAKPEEGAAEAAPAVHRPRRLGSTPYRGTCDTTVPRAFPAWFSGEVPPRDPKRCRAGTPCASRWTARR